MQKPYNLVFLGPQGSGKGTQAQSFSQDLNIAHISMGNILRQASQTDTSLAKILNSGNLVPDEITIELLEKRLKKGDTQKGYILDGFPRTLNQAQKLSDITNLKAVFLIDISDEEAIKRLSGRRTCPQCGAVYHIKHNPPKQENLCDQDNSKLIIRKDDQPQAIKKRLELYHKQIDPIINYYQKKDLLIKINGEQSIEGVTQDIKEKIS